jgi:hypothetical protein
MQLYISALINDNVTTHCFQATDQAINLMSVCILLSIRNMFANLEKKLGLKVWFS